MTLRTRSLLLILAAAAAATAVWIGCSERPEAPVRQNPLDPDAGGAGDPFSLTARKNGIAADLDWNDVSIPGNSGYSVYRSRDRDSLLAGALPPIAAGVRESAYRDSTPVADGTSYYLVTIRDDKGAESLRSAGVPFRLDLAPLLEIFDAQGKPADSTAAREVRITFVAENSDSFYLSNGLEAGDLREPVSRFAADASPIDWLLETGDADGARSKSVFGRARRADGTLSEVASDSIRVADPGFQIVIDGRADTLYTSSRRSIEVSLQRSLSDTSRPVGAESLEVSFEETPGPMEPFVQKRFPVALPGAAPAVLRVRVKNDFGWIAADSLTTRGDSLRTAGILLNNSATPGATDSTRLCRVNVHVTGGSPTAACISTAPIPPCLSFDSLGTAPVSIELAADSAGQWAFVYALLANEWRPEGAGVVVDSIFLLQSPLRIDILEPLATTGNSIVYGAMTTISGVGWRRTCGPEILAVTLSIADVPQDTGLVVESAAPSDTFDVRWSLQWTAPGSGDLVRVIARIEDAEGAVAMDTLDLSLGPAKTKGVIERRTRR